jgi:hypothetical protein
MFPTTSVRLIRKITLFTSDISGPVEGYKMPPFLDMTSGTEFVTDGDIDAKHVKDSNN